MAHRPCLSLLIATALALPSAAAVAEEGGEKHPFSLEFRAGAEYDSNLAVLELEASSGEGDVAAVVDLDIGFDKDLTKRLSFDVAYDFSQSLHREFDAFDLRIHRGSAGLGCDFGRLEAGVSFQYANAALHGDEYLVLRQATPHLSKLFGKRLFLRLAWDKTDKEFTGSPNRDATADAPSIDAFVLLDGLKSYLVFGCQRVHEDAADDELDYTGAKLKAQFTRRFTPGSRAIRLKTGLRYESRSYREVLLPIQARRQDDRYRFEAELEASLSEHAFVRARYEYADNRSNLSSVDFDDHVASIGFGAKL